MTALAGPLRARIMELLAAERLRTCHLAELTGARQTMHLIAGEGEER